MSNSLRMTIVVDDPNAQARYEYDIVSLQHAKQIAKVFFSLEGLNALLEKTPKLVPRTELRYLATRVFSVIDRNKKNG